MGSSVRLEDGSFSYGAREIFGGIDLEVQQGELLCLLGQNGCGKTTLLRCLAGALRLRTGRVLVDGRDLASLRVDEVARTIGIVFQEHTAPFPFSVLEVVRMGRAPYLGFLATPSHRDTEIALRTLELVGLSHLKDKAYTEISGGERQLVLIARTLCQEPQVILLDEPTSHLDFKNQALVLAMTNKLAQQGLTIIMSTHMPNHALMFPTRVALMSAGRLLAFGDSTEVITEDNLRQTYGIDVRLLTSKDERTGKTISFCTPVVESVEASLVVEHAPGDAPLHPVEALHDITGLHRPVQTPESEAGPRH